MKKFSYTLVSFLILGYILNLIGGRVLYIKQQVLSKKRLFYPNLRMKEFYRQNENVDIVFLGSSRCYQGFDPVVVDSITEMNSFNLGSSSQTPITSFYLLKEAYRLYQPEYVIMDISIDVLNSSQLINGGYILDAMDLSSDKIEFYLNGFDFKEQIALLFPLYRYRENRGFFYYALNEDLYDHYYRNRIYQGKGFVENYNHIEKGKTYYFTKTEKVDHNIEFIHKITDITDYNNSELIFVYLPYPSETQFTDREKFTKIVQDEIKNSNAHVVDYSEALEDRKVEYFADGNHLNPEGAQKISEDIALMIKNDEF